MPRLPTFASRIIKQKNMDPLDIIRKHYDENSACYRTLVAHSRQVADKALEIARMHPEMNLDLKFIEDAALLHDIGVVYTDAPDIDCHGKADYICHGYLGADLLRREGLPRHALVCERHTGTGLPLADIEQRKLPIPHRDMQPVSLEEQLICFADKFFSKTKLDKEKPLEKIRAGLERYGADSVSRFDNWYKLFLGE